MDDVVEETAEEESAVVEEAEPETPAIDVEELQARLAAAERRADELATVSRRQSDMADELHKENRRLRDGELQHDVMKRASITEHDLEEAMRLAGGPVDVRQLRSAHLERNGSISIVRDRIVT